MVEKVFGHFFCSLGETEEVGVIGSYIVLSRDPLIQRFILLVFFRIQCILYENRSIGIVLGWHEPYLED